MKDAIFPSLGSLLICLTGCHSTGGEPFSEVSSDSSASDTAVDANGSDTHPESDAPPDEVDSTSDTFEALDVADSDRDTAASSGWLGVQTFVAGTIGPPAEDGIAVTDAGWAILTAFGREPVTAATNDDLRTLDSGTPDTNKLALLPIDRDGHVGTPIEIAKTSGYIFGGRVTRCGDHLWGAATTSDSYESWVFRARTDLSDLKVAHFIATGTAATGDHGVAQIWNVQCGSAGGVFIVRLTGGMQIVSPASVTVDVPTVQGETWLLADATSLIEEGRLEHVGEANVYIERVGSGVGRTVIYTAGDVVEADQSPHQRILRHDFATGETSPVLDTELPSNVFNPIYAEAFDSAGSRRIAGLCARYQGIFSLDDATISDPLASDFCATVENGRVKAAITFRHIIPSGLTIANDLLWFSGSLAGADSTLGSAPPGGFLAFLVGLDPATLELRARASSYGEGRNSIAKSVLTATGLAQCPDQAGVAMEVATSDSSGNSSPAVQVVMAGRDSSACANVVAAVDGFNDGSGLPALFSPFNQPSCADARRLAILPRGITLSVAGQSTTFSNSWRDQFSIVAFAPEECSITAP